MFVVGGSHRCRLAPSTAQTLHRLLEALPGHKGKTTWSSWATDGLEKKMTAIISWNWWRHQKYHWFVQLRVSKESQWQFSKIKKIIPPQRFHLQEQRKLVHLNRAVPPRSSGAGFCPWSVPVEKQLKIGRSSSSHEGPCACLTCPQLIQMQGSRSWIKDKTRRCDNWH